jgi:hypothetical protein
MYPEINSTGEAGQGLQFCGAGDPGKEGVYFFITIARLMS